MFLSEGISSVQAFALPMGIGQDGQVNQSSGFAVVKWKSAYADKLCQVYVNGKFAGITANPLQRAMIVPLPFSPARANRIEVFACDVSDSIQERSAANGRVMIGFPKTDNLPVNGMADFYLGDEKLNKESLQLRGEYSDNGGFGLSSFGKSDFGYDGSAAIGFGKGSFGFGWFGYDAELFKWQSRQLQTGNYKFKVKITDDKGNESITETEIIPVAAAARPAAGLKVQSFDRQSGKVILEIL